MTETPIQNPKLHIQNRITLAVTHHDPDDAMLDQARRVLPTLRELYDQIVMLASPETAPHTIGTLRELGLQLSTERDADRMGLETMGLVRHDTLRLAADAGATFVHFCDWDRVLHWAEVYPDELRDVLDAIPRHDLLILGRTARAFASHPRVQRDTEAIANHAFGLAFGQELDVTAASRGLSRAALDHLLALDEPEPTIGNDCAWPLYLAQQPDLIIGYAATEGLEWETPDRYTDEISAAGGLDAWLLEYDADPAKWEFRMQLALHEVAAVNRWR